MKTRTLFFGTVLSLVFFSSNLKATDTRAIAEAKTQLNHEVSYLLQKAPFELVSDHENENQVTITFKVDESGKINSLKASSQNLALNRWIERKIASSDLTFDPMLSGVKYRLPVSYKVR